MGSQKVWQFVDFEYEAFWKMWKMWRGIGCEVRNMDPKIYKMPYMDEIEVIA